MRPILTVVFEIDFTVAALKESKAEESRQDIAFKKIQEIVNKWSGQDEYCKEGYRYTVVLDVPRDQGMLGALLYWCERGDYSHVVRWFVGELTPAQGV